MENDYFIKGTVSQDVLLQNFFMDHIPPAPKNTGGKLLPVYGINDSTKPVTNLPPVSTTPAVLVAKFSASVVDTGGK
jgi:hypothetical protein